ncbi:baseplate J/gp47 family protein, partial [Patescibacteria group bacterium]|nr:baseplate J/gp47 family protein [Patescibacteria group bacterium]
VKHMQRVSLEIYTTAYEAVKILEKVADHRVELVIPAGSVLFDNILTLKLIAEQAKKKGKSVDFVTADPFGQQLIKLLRGESEEVPFREPGVSGPDPAPVKKSGKKFHLPTFAPLSAFRPNLKTIGLVLPVVILLLLGVGFFVFRRSHKATVVLHFSPQVLTKSVVVKVGDGLKTDLDSRVLGGLKIARSLDYSLENDTTGTKLEGEKASGKVTLYNYTADEVTIKKGTELTYQNKDDKFVFLTVDEATLPASTTESPSPPAKVITPGSAEVEVTAKAIGAAYNIKKDQELDVKGYDSDEMSAISAENFSGGSSEEVKIVTQADITKLEQELTALAASDPAEALKNAPISGFSFIDKSGQIVNQTIVVNNKIGEEKAKLSGSITAQVEGLTYSQNELADFMGKLSQNLVPPGFDFYSYKKDINVEVLGNTESTVLKPTEADLQVTFRFFIAPKIERDVIFADIAGKSVQEAVELLEDLNGVETVEVKIQPPFSLIKRIPTRGAAVEIKTEIGEQE